jgi:hypothetical protein
MEAGLIPTEVFDRLSRYIVHAPEFHGIDREAAMKVEITYCVQ